jgi:hypothetical protein
MLRRLLLAGLLVAVAATPGFAASTLQLATGTLTTIMSSELNSIASNGWTAASTVTADNRIGQALNGYLICRIEWNVTFAANPTAAGGFTGWFLKTADGTNFENTPTASIALGRPPDFFLPVTTGQTGTRVMLDVRCPAERFKIVGNLSNTGQTTAASGNTIKILPITIQGNP